jgi:ElaB/YqjD/DUF883 family membrane-anchored ribosome-binding protein
MGTHGGDRRSETAKDQVDIINLKTQGGTSRAYILARLDRDGHAELAAKVRAGKLSANAAAIEAGFRKHKTPLERWLKLLPKMTRSELRQARARIDELLNDTKRTTRHEAEAVERAVREAAAATIRQPNATIRLRPARSSRKRPNTVWEKV